MSSPRLFTSKDCGAHAAALASLASVERRQAAGLARTLAALDAAILQLRAPPAAAAPAAAPSAAPQPQACCAAALARAQEDHRTQHARLAQLRDACDAQRAPASCR